MPHASARHDSSQHSEEAPSASVDISSTSSDSATPARLARAEGCAPAAWLRCRPQPGTGLHAWNGNDVFQKWPSHQHDDSTSGRSTTPKPWLSPRLRPCLQNLLVQELKPDVASIVSRIRMPYWDMASATHLDHADGTLA